MVALAIQPREAAEARVFLGREHPPLLLPEEVEDYQALLEEVELQEEMEPLR